MLRLLEVLSTISKISYRDIDNYIKKAAGNNFNLEGKKNAEFPGGSAVKNLPANAEDAGSIPGLGRLPGEGNGNPL